MARQVDVTLLRAKIMEKLASENFFNDMTGQLLGTIEEGLEIDSVSFNDALHPEVHNDLLQATREIVEWVLEAWNRDGDKLL